MYDPHVYKSLVNIDEIDLSEDPSSPVEILLPDPIMSTASSINIQETLSASIPHVVEEPIWSPTPGPIV